MKYAFITLVLAFFSFGNSLFGQYDKYEPEYYVNGGFKKCKRTTIIYNYENEKGKIKKIVSNLTYNSKGFLIKEIIGNVPGWQVSKIIYNYNKNNYLIQKKDFYKRSRPKICVKTSGDQIKRNS